MAAAAQSAIRQEIVMSSLGARSRTVQHADRAHRSSGVIQQQHWDNARVARQHGIGDVEVKARRPQVYQVRELLESVLEHGVAHLHCNQ